MVIKEMMMSDRKQYKFFITTPWKDWIKMDLQAFNLNSSVR